MIRLDTPNNLEYRRQHLHVQSLIHQIPSTSAADLSLNRHLTSALVSCWDMLWLYARSSDTCNNGLSQDPPLLFALRNQGTLPGPTLKKVEPGLKMI